MILTTRMQFHTGPTILKNRKAGWFNLWKRKSPNSNLCNRFSSRSSNRSTKINKNMLKSKPKWKVCRQPSLNLRRRPNHARDSAMSWSRWSSSWIPKWELWFKDLQMKGKPLRSKLNNGKSFLKEPIKPIKSLSSSMNNKFPNSNQLSSKKKTKSSNWSSSITIKLTKLPNSTINWPTIPWTTHLNPSNLKKNISTNPSPKEIPYPTSQRKTLKSPSVLIKTKRPNNSSMPFTISSPINLCITSRMTTVTSGFAIILKKKNLKGKCNGHSQENSITFYWKDPLHLKARMRINWVKKIQRILQLSVHKTCKHQKWEESTPVQITSGMMRRRPLINWMCLVSWIVVKNIKMTICRTIGSMRTKNILRWSSGICAKQKLVEASKRIEIPSKMDTEKTIVHKKNTQKYDTPNSFTIPIKCKQLKHKDSLAQGKHKTSIRNNRHVLKTNTPSKQQWKNHSTKKLQLHQDSTTLPKTLCNHRTKRKKSIDTITVACMKNSKSRKFKTSTPCAITWFSTINPILCSAVAINCFR